MIIGKETGDIIHMHISDFHLKILTQENQNMFKRTLKDEMLVIVYQIQWNIRTKLKLKIGKR